VGSSAEQCTSQPLLLVVRYGPGMLVLTWCTVGAGWTVGNTECDGKRRVLLLGVVWVVWSQGG
jgi:hypothetical protein